MVNAEKVDIRRKTTKEGTKWENFNKNVSKNIDFECCILIGLIRVNRLCVFVFAFVRVCVSVWKCLQYVVLARR